MSCGFFVCCLFFIRNPSLFHCECIFKTECVEIRSCVWNNKTINPFCELFFRFCVPFHCTLSVCIRWDRFFLFCYSYQHVLLLISVALFDIIVFIVSFGRCRSVCLYTHTIPFIYYHFYLAIWAFVNGLCLIKARLWHRNLLRLNLQFHSRILACVWNEHFLLWHSNFRTAHFFAVTY